MSSNENSNIDPVKDDSCSKTPMLSGLSVTQCDDPKLYIAAYFKGGNPYHGEVRLLSYLNQKKGSKKFTFQWPLKGTYIPLNQELIDEKKNIIDGFWSFSYPLDPGDIVEGNSYSFFFDWKIDSKGKRKSGSQITTVKKITY